MGHHPKRDQNMEMKLTLRMGDSDAAMLDEIMLLRGNSNRSDLIREAIQCYVEKLRSANGMGSDDGIFVHLPSGLMNAIETIVSEGFLADSVEDFVRQCVRAKLVQPQTEADLIRKSMETTMEMSKYS